MVEICAHRGESWTHLENTLPAVAAALEAGVATIEIDVRITADGVPIVLHDATTARIWGRPSAVRDQTMAQVAELRCGGDRIPRLSEVLDLVAGTGVRLLVDVPDPAIAQGAHAVVAAHPGRGQVAWCGDTLAMFVVRGLDADASIYLATEGVDEHDLRELVGRLRPDHLNSDGSELTPSDLRRCHDLGLAQSVWTIDDPAAMALLVDLGVDSITTNRIDLLAAVVAAGPPRAIPADLARARDVALDLAGFALRRSRAGARRVETKSGAADLVTDVDRAVETRVREILTSAFPTHRVVGEEAGVSGPDSAWSWHCDPVDGTTNFAAGLAFSSFSLCLVHEGRPVVGVVVDHGTGQVVDAVAGGGVRIDGLPVERPETPLSGGVVLTELHGNRWWPGLDRFYDACVAADATLRIMGSGTLSLTQVALGRAAACAISEFHAIDHGAALLACLEAGCRIRTAPLERGAARDVTGEAMPLGAPVVVGRSEALAALGGPTP
ncbi:inositol monophosphatase family protein [Agilicoccus flavus]|uniref:inositol monophosphatase family protein n=1 Tax=Agilicoccus flavus TaxID=2775968 RepID=UPI001CF6AA00|nr:inositol monophosphatase family protein [Agilicoccus flavus]